MGWIHCDDSCMRSSIDSYLVESEFAKLGRSHDERSVVRMLPCDEEVSLDLHVVA